MEEKFMDSLISLELRIQASQSPNAAVLMDRLDDLSLSMLHEDMTDDEYLKWMQLYAQKYIRSNNKKALRYCLMRMEQVIAYGDQPRKQRQFPHLVFTDKKNPTIVEFMKAQTSIYQRNRIRFTRRILQITVILFCLLLPFHVLLLGMSFFAGWFLSVLLCGLFFYIGQGYYFERMLEEQFERLSHSVDTNCLAVDEAVRSQL